MVARYLVVLVVAGLSSLSSTALADMGKDVYYARVVDYQFEDIAGMSDAVRTLAGTDEAYTSVTLPFTFSMYGRDVSSLMFYNSNALITFGYWNSDFANKDLTILRPDAGVPTIAVLWDDWLFKSSGTDGVYYNTLGPAGNRRFVIQWNQAVPWDAGNDATPNPVTFQAVLYEGSNDIRFNYLDVSANAGHANGASATVGICDAYGYDNGRRLQWSYNQAAVTDQSSILFTTTPVPVPGTALLTSLGLVVWVRRRMS